VRGRVEAARKRQDERGVVNAGLTRRRLDEVSLTAAARRLLTRSVRSAALTARGWDRVRRVALTCADLDESAVVGETHVAEALALRVTS
jgi:magnesium chelatase family protein